MFASCQFSLEMKQFLDVTLLRMMPVQTLLERKQNERECILVQSENGTLNDLAEKSRCQMKSYSAKI